MNETQENKIAIYVLVDPRKPEIIKYVGQTGLPRIRHLEHCSKTECTRKGEWIESLRQEGIFPQMIIKEWVPKLDARLKELEYINKYKINNPITNTGNLKNELYDKNREKEIIENLLIQNDWNKVKTAKILQMGRQTLYNKIKLYEIIEPQININNQNPNSLNNNQNKLNTDILAHL